MPSARGNTSAPLVALHMRTIQSFCLRWQTGFGCSPYRNRVLSSWRAPQQALINE
jgi:hypothetical protein